MASVLSTAIAGGYVGVTKFSPDFMVRFYRFCESYFDKSGDSHKYERLFDQMVRIEKVDLNYQDVSKFCWLNINTKKDYDLASGSAKDFYPWT